MRRAISSVLRLQKNSRQLKVSPVSECNMIRQRQLPNVAPVHRPLINVESGGILYRSFVQARAFAVDAVHSDCQGKLPSFFYVTVFLIRASSVV